MYKINVRGCAEILPQLFSLSSFGSNYSTELYFTQDKDFVSKETVVLRRWGVETNIYFYHDSTHCNTGHDALNIPPVHNRYPAMY